MTETRNVSIDEVRTLVVERQRYDDWLTALESRRADTPLRVFERVHGDYVARRREVMNQLREHVGELTTMVDDLDARLASLELSLGTLEDERAEAMLRTAVGEFDSDRWEQVRQHVEAQIAELGEQRTSLQAEVEEVRALLGSARSEPAVEPSPEASSPQDSEVVELAVVESSSPVAPGDVEPTDALVDGLGTDDTFGMASTGHVAAAPLDGLIVDEPLTPISDTSTTDQDLAELDNALSVFSNDPPKATFGSPSAQPASTGNGPSLDGLDVFDDAELGDLRMAPPALATATATPPGSTNATDPANGAATRDGFDDLAFLRSVVDPSAQGGNARASTSGDQPKTLRCTECGTMNLPTEWYCERCGGELAAF